jgi:hypothetical protein
MYRHSSDYPFRVQTNLKLFFPVIFDQLSLVPI